VISPVVIAGLCRARLYDRCMAPPELERMSLTLVGRE
jgi:hypothetical protein